MDEKVSVIIPAYNAEKFIVECLDSVENQTYKNIEIIVVDDGSKDNTYNVVKEYAEKHASVVLVHQENGGVCSARNKGIDLATGEYVMFLDADDWILSDTIEVLHSDSINYGADIAIGKMISDSMVVTSEGDGDFVVWNGKEAVIKDLEDHPALYGCWNKLYRKNLINDVRFEVGRKIHEDGFFVFSVLIKLPTVVVRNKSTYVYRCNPNSASHATFSEKFFDVLYFEEKTRKIVTETFPELTDLAYNGIVKAHLTMLHCFCTTKEKKYKKDIKNSIKMVRKYRKYFIPAIPGDKKFFLIVRYGLYWLFRRLYWIKYPLKEK